MSSGAGSPLLVYCTEGRVSSVLVYCTVSCVLSCFVLCLYCCGILGWEFLAKVGRVRFPGEFGGLAAYVGVPYLR